jgi:hypothetical protein
VVRTQSALQRHRVKAKVLRLCISGRCSCGCSAKRTEPRFRSGARLLFPRCSIGEPPVASACLIQRTEQVSPQPSRIPTKSREKQLHNWTQQEQGNDRRGTMRSLILGKLGFFATLLGLKVESSVTAVFALCDRTGDVCCGEPRCSAYPEEV